MGGPLKKLWVGEAFPTCTHVSTSPLFSPRVDVLKNNSQAQPFITRNTSIFACALAGSHSRLTTPCAHAVSVLLRLYGTYPVQHSTVQYRGTVGVRHPGFVIFPRAFSPASMYFEDTVYL